MAKPLPKIDPNTSIPTAVRRQVEEAEAIQKQVYAAPEAPPAEAAPEATPEVTPPGNPELSFSQPAPEVTPAGNEQPAPVPSNDNWEHRYNSMKGRYDRAQNDIRAMSEQLANLQNVVASIQAAPPANDNPAELRPQSFLTPEEVSEYGAEFLGVVAKKAKEELSPEVAALKKELASIKAQVQGTREVNSAQARRNLEVTLDEKIPHWRDINVTPEFHSWLALPDEFSGVIRHNLLKAAYEQHDTPRTLAFFKGFLANEAASAPAPDGQPAPAADATSGKIPLETFAAPGRAKTAAATGAPAEKPTFTTAQITQFYADAAAQRFRGREDEKNRIEAQIFEATREGRIR